MSQNLSGAIYRTHEHVVCTEFDGGEGVLVDLNTRRYYQLNETGMLIWRTLEKGGDTSEIVAEMVSSYSVTPEHAAQSVEKLLQTLLSYKLIDAQASHTA